MSQKRSLGVTGQPSQTYENAVAALDKCIEDCIDESHACAGLRSPTSSHYYASLLFTSLCTRGVSLISLLPHSPWATKRLENWDFASTAGLVRSILEVRLAFFYLCIEKIDIVEWQCRWNTLNLHDCISRIALFQEMPDSEREIEGFKKQQIELGERLAENACFQAMPEGRRRQILNGKIAYLSPLEEIASRAQIKTQDFRVLYKLFSSQVHGFPLSFYRMAEQNRGRGIHSKSEEGYTTFCVSLAVQLLEASRSEMRILFGDVKGQ